MMVKRKCPGCGGDMAFLVEEVERSVHRCPKCSIIIDADTGETFKVEVLETLWKRCEICGKGVDGEKTECHGKLVDDTCGGAPGMPPCEHEECCHSILDSRTDTKPCPECGEEMKLCPNWDGSSSWVCPKCGKMVTEKGCGVVLRFFREHPVHSFAVKAIAEYLKIPEDKVRVHIAILLEQGQIVERFQLSTAGLKKLNEERLRELKP